MPSVARTSGTLTASPAALCESPGGGIDVDPADFALCSGLSRSCVYESDAERADIV
jgi:hypothetical protein